MPRGCKLEVSYQGPGLPRQTIPDSALFRAVVDAASGATNWVNGLEYRGYEGRWKHLPDFSRLRPVKSGTAANFDIGVKSPPTTSAWNSPVLSNCPATGHTRFTPNPMTAAGCGLNVLAQSGVGSGSLIHRCHNQHRRTSALTAPTGSRTNPAAWERPAMVGNRGNCDVHSEGQRPMGNRTDCELRVHPESNARMLLTNARRCSPIQNSRGRTVRPS